jgi:O-glycosyl hydrolase
MAWGNLNGIRIEGHLFELNSSMCVVQPDWSGVFTTGREKQTNSYSRNGKIETVTVRMNAPREFRDADGNGWSLNGKEVVEETGVGTAKVDIQFDSPAESNIAGAYWCLDLPAALFSGGSVELAGAVKPTPARVSLAPGLKDQNEYVRGTAKGLHFTSGRREIEIAFSEPTQVLIRDDRRKGNYNLQVMMAVLTGKAAAGQTASKSFAVKVAGDIDRNPVTVALDTAHPGQLFDGLGGDFRLQNPRADPGIIDYNLKNLRVAWGRVEMPWRTWQTNENDDPLGAARSGTVAPAVQQAMEMARRLAQKGMPVIVSAWAPPAWAVLGMSGRGYGGGFGGAGAGRGGGAPATGVSGAQPNAAGRGGAAGAGRGGAAPATAAAAPGTQPNAAGRGGAGRGGAGAMMQQPEGLRGYPLNPEKMDQIKKSIADYLVFLKEHFGVEAAMFTFNESDLGIDVRQTGREHNEMIKTFGSYFASRGLATKLALGDTSDATPVDFIQPALHDPEAAKYIAAVDFHSWRGCTDEILAQWYAAARQLNVPLIVAEGSTDAAAYRYAQIFAEQSFALYEINLYLRILAVAQPRSILQWQLTSDYSILAGGGAFGDNGPIRPTRRFWNLKQLASTPERSFSMPLACNGPNLTCAGFGNIADGVYTIHMVNNGAARQATLTGLPANVKELRVWVTDSQKGMEEGARIPVSGGKAELQLEATSYTTVISVP